MGSSGHFRCTLSQHLDSPCCLSHSLTEQPYSVPSEPIIELDNQEPRAVPQLSLSGADILPR
jgi:hypothetical protein